MVHFLADLNSSIDAKIDNQPLSVIKNEGSTPPKAFSNPFVYLLITDEVVATALHATAAAT